MCGIAGFQGTYSQELLQAMTSTLAHRGPDGEGTVIKRAEGQPDTGLGHRRLAIIDLSSAAAQPMVSHADRGGGMQSGLTLIFNGEIYNYRELRSELQADGHDLRTNSDSEVLLHLYERDGFAMLERLNGIFAFAIHDARAAGRPDGVQQGSLFLARDQLGVKPLYYTESANGFLFGSEMKALLCDRTLSRTIDTQVLHNTVAYLWSPAPRTMLRGIFKLEPGTALLVHDGRIQRKWRYYDIPYDGGCSTASREVLAEELAERVQVAVKRQLISDVPVGAFLSGGLDSSSVVAMMRRAAPNEQIRCYSIGFPDDMPMEGNPQDLPYARRAARHIGVDLHEIEVAPNAINRLAEMVALLDEPQADPAPINALLIAEQARADGIPVLLSGAGGDDLFGGYRRHWALTFERRWAWLPQLVRSGMQTVSTSAATSAGQSRHTLRRLTKMFAYAGETPERRLAAYFLWGNEAVRRSLYSPALASETAATDTLAPLLESLQRIPNERDPLQRMLYLEAKHFLADHNLNYTDRAGMASGVEIRVPLLDIDLVEFATRVPARYKQSGRTGKPLFKQAMEPYLPRDIIYRPKSGFGAPLRRWLRDELAPMADELLSPDSLKRRGFFDPTAVNRLIRLNKAGRVDAAYTIFALMCFELWCRRFVD